jgi:hypothetical protein
VKPLENVPDRLKDWHPGSEGKVLDLVHPSLFPVILGTTRALLPSEGIVPLQNCALWTGKGQTTMNGPDEEGAKFRRPPTWTGGALFPHGWGSYQWLPSNVKLCEDGKAKITSYINNLHPARHVELYQLLEKIVDATIPLWNEVLTEYDDRMRIEVTSASDEDFELKPDCKYPLDVTPDGLEVVHKENSDDDTDDDLQYDDHYRDWKRANSTLAWPEPTKPYRPYSELIGSENTKVVDLAKQFGDSGLQVIFKLANIILTPDTPTYDGGSWHIEGALNEHIAATAIVYYDQENITESKLCFRHTIDGETLVMLPAQVFTSPKTRTFRRLSTYCTILTKTHYRANSTRWNISSA